MHTSHMSQKSTHRNQTENRILIKSRNQTVPRCPSHTPFADAEKDITNRRFGRDTDCQSLDRYKYPLLR